LNLIYYSMKGKKFVFVHWNKKKQLV